ncbi:MucBP domain-containing protein [Lactococcus petauri]|uniref:MucBP domain-containing protein n=1 Tax=Lactococcus petauri TaxID=1940789 RepID=UPI00254FBD29|nr:MucBP domain-containing protein [Lactococcus petauri]
MLRNLKKILMILICLPTIFFSGRTFTLEQHATDAQVKSKVDSKLSEKTLVVNTIEDKNADKVDKNEVQKSAPVIEVTEPQTPVIFLDENLRKEISIALGKDVNDVIMQNDISHLTSLNLSSTSLYSLSGLEFAKNLESIYMNVDNQITDFRPLEKLTSLSHVTLQSRSLNSENFPDLTGNKKLRYLALGGTSIDNNVLPKIAKIKSLDRLYLDENTRLSTIEPLNQLPNLKSLSVQVCGITDFSTINTFPALTDLAAYGQAIGIYDTATTIGRSILSYNITEKTIFIPFSLMPNRMKNFDGYIPPFEISNSPSKMSLNFNGVQLSPDRIRVDDSGITILSVDPEQYKEIKTIEYNARLNNPTGSYKKPEGYGFYSISSGTYLHKFNVLDEAGKVTAHYEDTEGNIISQDAIFEGYIGEKYETEKRNLPGYVLKNILGSPSGTFSDEPIEVTYIYSKIQPIPDGKIVVKYIDEEGVPISDTAVIIGKIGDPYRTNKKNIIGYTFKKIDGRASGVIGSSPQTIFYIYTKNHDKDVIVSPNKPNGKDGVASIDKTDEKDKDAKQSKKTKVATKIRVLPKAGQQNELFLVVIGSLILLVLVVSIILIKIKKRK